MRLFSVTALAAIAAASIFAASPVEVTARDAAIDGEFDGMSSFVTTADYKSSTKRQKARLTSPGWLYVETVPADASISIGDAATVGRGTAFHESADAAFVAVKVTAPGYRTFEGYIELKERTVRKVRVELDVMGGSVSVLARPFGSKVTIDGEFVGKTPLTVSGVKAGAREVAVEAKGCKGPLMIMVEVDGMFVLGEDTCAPKMRDVRPTTTPSPKEEREEAAAPAPAPAPEPAPAPVAQPAPAPVAKPAPAPAPAPVAKPEPAPASAPAAQTQGGKKPQCDKICDKFVQAVSPASMQGYIRNSCMTRCESGDLDFSVCAWKAQSMADVQNCNKLPKK